MDAVLPDVTGMALADLLASDDPDIVAAVERLVEEVRDAERDDGLLGRRKPARPSRRTGGP